ncbi:PLDc N-terminal domain-containing protein [Paenibacillaceae bacterium WGS1546]|uniref:PLDc N-terminal domain-containing protein n=1 Tax=Cohnella sp. WGS1546 TaxID=3366810 RepID=UPI00372D522E
MSKPELIKLLLPLIAIQLVLMITALIYLYRAKSVRGNNKWLWVPIIVIVNIVGPVLFFAFGRKEDGR